MGRIPLTFFKTTAKLGGSMTKRTHLVVNFFGAVLLFAISTVVGASRCGACRDLHWRRN